MKYRNSVIRYSAALVPTTSLLLSGVAGATGPDFSSITSGLDASTITTAVIAAAALLALVGFAKWGAKKLGKFFG